MKKGLFIVIEGIDGAGKTTQVHRIVQYLFGVSKRNHIFLTREPYISEHYDKIRELLKSGTDLDENKEQFSELFVADRRVHAEVMNRALNEGTHVVCDRYKHSTLVYQTAQGMEMEALLSLHEGLPVPDLTIILDVPASVALSRIHVDDARTHAEFFEKEHFLEKLRQGYLDLAKRLKDEKIVIIDGTLKPEEAFMQIRKELEKIV